MGASIDSIGFYSVPRSCGLTSIELFDESSLISMLNDSDLMFSCEISELFASKEKCCPKWGKKMVVRKVRRIVSKLLGDSVS
jgi:hypothetical protein